MLAVDREVDVRTGAKHHCIKTALKKDRHVAPRPNVDGIVGLLLGPAAETLTNVP